MQIQSHTQIPCYQSFDETKSYRYSWDLQVQNHFNAAKESFGKFAVYVYQTQYFNTYYVLYSGKLWWEKTLANLENWWPINKVFSLIFTDIQYPFLLICRAFANVFFDQHFPLYSTSEGSLSLINNILSWKEIEAVWKITFLTLLRASYVQKPWNNFLSKEVMEQRKCIHSLNYLRWMID